MPTETYAQRFAPGDRVRSKLNPERVGVIVAVDGNAVIWHVDGQPEPVRATPRALDLARCSGTTYPVNPDEPAEGSDVHHAGPCPVHP